MYCLVDLNLSDNGLGDRATILLIEGLKGNKTVTKLNLNRNKIASSGLKAVALYLSSTTNLKMLGLSWNEFHGSAALEIGEALNVNQSLHTLDLSWNSLGAGNIVQSLARTIMTSTSLTHLDISNNGFSIAQCTMLSNALCSNRIILGLHMEGNAGRIDCQGYLQPNLTAQGMTTSTITSDILQCFDEVDREPPFDLHATHAKCWICGRWTEVEFTWSSEIDGFIDSNEAVFIHLSVDKFTPQPMHNLGDDMYSLFRVLPPGLVYYFFSAVDKVSNVVRRRNVILYICS